MTRPTILAAFLVLLCANSLAQQKYDVIHLLQGPKEVQIKEVGFNEIKYSYPNETSVYSVSKHQVTKIEFGNGREEVFQSPFKKVNGLNDSKDVFITYHFEDVAGLNRMGDLFSKATGVTTLSSINTVKNRAVDKLKAEAAMVGANVVLVGDMYQRGNEYGGENQVGNSTQTTFSGIAYSTEKLDLEKTKEMIGSKSFHHYQTHKLNRNAWSPERTMATSYDKNQKPVLFKISQLIEREGELYAKATEIPSRTKELKVISVSSDSIILMERNEKITINYYLISEDNKYFKNLSQRVIL